MDWISFKVNVNIHFFKSVFPQITYNQIHHYTKDLKIRWLWWKLHKLIICDKHKIYQRKDISFCAHLYLYLNKITLFEKTFFFTLYKILHFFKYVFPVNFKCKTVQSLKSEMSGSLPSPNFIKNIVFLRKINANFAT